jgi:hypothetical protein
MPVADRPRNGRCFVIMPFKRPFDDVYGAIRSAAASIGLACHRADERSISGHVLDLVFDDIKRADVVAIDLTGGNPNVFYEAAYAHLHKDERQVIHISQRDEAVPFDVRARRYLEYDNNGPGRAALRRALVPFLREARAAGGGGPYETIEGKLERTRRICADCRALLQQDDSALCSTVIRSQAGFGPLAISSAEARHAHGEERVYREALVEQRNLLLALLRRGARYRLIASLPSQWLFTETNIEHRYRQFARLLHDESPALQQVRRRCEIALAPPGLPNALILGRRAIYEGKKTSFSGGFHLTTRVTDAAWITSYVRGFDLMFKDASRYTLEKFAPRARNLRQAVLAGLELSLANSKRQRPAD